MAKTASAVETRRPDPEAWRLALVMADGDARRLAVSDDGRTVTVRNAPR